MKQKLQNQFIQQLVAARTPTEILNIREDVVTATRIAQDDTLQKVRKLLNSLIPISERVNVLMNEIYDEVLNPSRS